VHLCAIAVAVPKPIRATPDGQVDVRHVGRPLEASVARGAEVQDLDLEVPHPSRDAVRGTHHAVVFGAGGVEAVGREHRSIGCPSMHSSALEALG
jgi:hypothetical protein